MPAGDLLFPSWALMYDASDNLHPAFHDGQHWHPIGRLQLAEGEVGSDVAVAAGTTVTVLSLDVNFAGLSTVCEVVADFPEVDFTATSGGEALFSVNLGGTSHALGHMHGDRSLGWPARFARRLPAPGAGVSTFTLNAQSVSGALTLHADADTLYGPISLSVAAIA
jgi:hypothetical protein